VTAIDEGDFLSGKNGGLSGVIYTDVSFGQRCREYKVYRRLPGPRKQALGDSATKPNANVTLRLV